MTLTKNLKIINNASYNTTLQVTVINNNDWPDQNARPDHQGNFQGQVIKSHSEVEYTEKGVANAWFTVTANFTDGSSVTFNAQLSDTWTKKVHQCSNGYLILEDSLDGILILTIMPYSRWMGDHMQDLGNRTLRRICLPGSHDSGMCINESGTLISWDDITIAQKMTIRDQLAMGVRYFDLRVIKGSGKYHTGHFDSHQGGRGLSFDDIIAQINDFTSYCKGEVIILTVSHSMDTDSGYGPFERWMWEGFFTQLKGLNNLYTVQANDLTQVKLKDFVKDGHSAVLVVVTENPRDLPSTINWGLFPWIHQGSTFPMYDQYANTMDVDTMIEDQLTKMKNHKTEPDDPVFLLSWTLTQNIPKYIFSSIIGQYSSVSIKSLASMANSSLNYILPACSTQSFPNIIHLDYLFPDLPILPICHAINTHFAVDDNAVEEEKKTAGYFLLCNLKRQAVDGRCYLDSGTDPYMSNFHSKGGSDWTLWKMHPVERKPCFKLINFKRDVPVSASGEPNHFLVNQDTRNDYSKWLMSFFPSPLYGYDYESALFCLINLSQYTGYVLHQKGAKIYMDANTDNNTPFLNASPNAPWLPVCDYNASNVWRFDKPI